MGTTGLGDLVGENNGQSSCPNYSSLEKIHLFIEAFGCRQRDSIIHASIGKHRSYSFLFFWQLGRRLPCMSMSPILTSIRVMLDAACAYCNMISFLVLVWTSSTCCTFRCITFLVESAKNWKEALSSSLLSVSSSSLWPFRSRGRGVFLDTLTQGTPKHS